MDHQFAGPDHRLDMVIGTATMAGMRHDVSQLSQWFARTNRTPNHRRVHLQASEEARKATRVRPASRFPSPFIDEAGANIGAPRDLSHHGARLLDRRHNLCAFLSTPATAALSGRDQRQSPDAIQLTPHVNASYARGGPIDHQRVIFERVAQLVP
jgi:hypothetical protein